MKTLLKVLIALGVLLVVAALVAFLFLDGIVKAAIEKGGTYALGVETTVANADLDALGGDLKIGGLRIANPEGFEGEHFLAVGTGEMQLSLGSLREDTIEIPLLTMADLVVLLERKGDGSNYGTILDNLEKLQSEGEDEEAEPGDEKRFVIRKVEVRNVRVHASLSAIGGELTDVDVPIELIELEDVTSDGGSTMKQLVGILVEEILKAVLEKGAVGLPGDIVQGLTRSLGKLGGVGTDVLRGAAGEVQGAVERTLEGAGRALEGVLGGGKD
jgi:hypothetical protein